MRAALLAQASQLTGDRFAVVPCALCHEDTLTLAGYGDRVICPTCSGVAVEPPVGTVALPREIIKPLDVPPRYRYDERKYPKTSHAKLAQVLAWQYGPKGLVLNGPTGTGKTIAMYSLCSREHESGRTVEHMTAAEFSYEVMRAFGAFEQDRLITRMTKCDIFFIDDIGNSELSERAKEVLFHVFETRTKNLLPIFATTNYVSQELADKIKGDMGAALARRLKEYSVNIIFTKPEDKK
jgi:chromosomal replication initiation ATPase DnaA